MIASDALQNVEFSKTHIYENQEMQSYGTGPRNLFSVPLELAIVTENSACTTVAFTV